MEKHHDIRELFSKYLNNSISREEYEVLLKYFGKQKDEGDLRSLVNEALSNDTAEYDSVRLGQAVDSVAFQLREKLQPRKVVYFGKYMRYAAILLLFFMIGITYYIFSGRNGELKKHSVTANDVKPGHSAATLTLANGKKISLDNINSGKIASEQGINVLKTKNGEIIYSIKELSVESEKSINTLSTAKGETYQIILSDGTKVWLNAATTLQYSANLRARGRRNVKLLAGEAYFEVSKDKAYPFVVETALQKTEVLGTHFNINSYSDEGRTVTTLAEGSVRVSATGNAVEESAVLKPGQQSVFGTGKIKVQDADLQSALAWKEGKIYFRDAPIQEVLRQVSRWYNIQVEYEGEPTKEVFNGGIKRTANLSSVLRILELSNVHFELTKQNNTTTLKVTQIR